VLMARGKGERLDEGVACEGLDDPRLDPLLPGHALKTLREQVAMARALLPAFDREAYLAGNLTPMFFGSALNNFGVAELLQGLTCFAPAPRSQPAIPRAVDPEEEAVTGFVFKIQANMDPKHRDRVAFVRLASGHFRRGMKLKHVRSGKLLTMHNPMLFLARDREFAEEAYAGDIVGIPNHGNLHIGDTLSEGEELAFTGIPSFAPEHLQRVRAADPLKAKHLGRALRQLAEEGAARVFKPVVDADWVVGVMGPLQFDVLADRIRTEYEVPVRFEPAHLHTARWLEADSAQAVKAFAEANRAAMAQDHTGAPVFLARNAWHLDKARQDAPQVRFLKVREQTPVAAAATAA
jgi:peptide chain release factor 3